MTTRQIELEPLH